MPILTSFFKFNKNLTRLFLALLILINFSFTNSAFAQERVYTYSSIIKVLANRSLDVTEIITVVVENKKIRHGIYRDFETFRVNQSNKKVKVDLKIIGVKRNGVKEQYHTLRQGNKIRIFFGSKNKLVSKGIQTYIFHYITTNQLNSYNNKDEFYWNASGNKWSMPIFRVEATVILPSTVKRKSISFNAYSGYTGVNKQDYISSFSNNHTVKFALNRKYLSGNGLTIAIAWPSGLIDAAKRPLSKIKSISNISNANLLEINKKIDTVRSEQAELIASLKKTLAQNELEIQNLQKNTALEIIQDSSLLNTVTTAVEQLKKSYALAETNVEPSRIPISQDKPKMPDLSPRPTPKIATTNFFNNANNVITKIFSEAKLNNYIGIIGVLIILLYFLGIQLFPNKRMSPQKNNTIANSNNIPEDLSPASIRYINEMGYDDRTFAIALINIAVKGHIDIINSDNGYKIERRDFSAAEKLSKDEKLLLHSLMGNESVIKLESKNHIVIHQAMTNHRKLLETDNKAKYFTTNKISFNIGVALTILTGLAIALLENNVSDAILTFSLLSSFAVVTFFSAYIILDILNYYKNFKIKSISQFSFYQSVKESKEAYVFAILSFELALALLLNNYISLINLFAIGVAAFICAVFSDYLLSPNTEGKDILNKITHLKEFITDGEMLQADAHYDSIQISQKISAFDNYLPYTIALGVESEWGDHYSLLFDNRNEKEDVLAYSPHWYHGNGWNENNTTGFCESLSSKFTFSAASAAKSPKRNFNQISGNNTKH